MIFYPKRNVHIQIHLNDLTALLKDWNELVVMPL